MTSNEFSGARAGKTALRAWCFAKDEAGAATPEFTVVTGLVVTVCVVLLFNVSGGTSEAAVTLNDDIARSGQSDPARAGDGEAGGADSGGGWDDGWSGGQAGGGTTGAPSGAGPAVSGDPGGNPAASGSAGAGEKGEDEAAGNDDDTRVAETVSPAEDKSATGASGNGEDKGNDKNDKNDKDKGGSSSRGGSGNDDCGLGKGNASATGNKNANDRAKSTPSSGC